MNSKRLYFLMCGLLALMIVAIFGGTYETNALLARQSQKLVSAKAKLGALNEQQIELAQAKKDIKTYNDLYQISRTIVPESKDQAETVRQIVSLAQQSGVTIGSITFPASTLGGSGATTTTSNSSASLGTNASASSSAGAALSQLQKVSNIPGVYTLQLVVSSSTDSKSLATYPELISFLSALEQNRLTALVSKISIVPSTGGSSGTGTTTTSTSGTFTFTLTLNIYIKP